MVVLCGEVDRSGTGLDNSQAKDLASTFSYMQPAILR